MNSSFFAHTESLDAAMALVLPGMFLVFGITYARARASALARALVVVVSLGGALASALDFPLGVLVAQAGALVLTLVLVRARAALTLVLARAAWSRDLPLPSSSIRRPPGTWLLRLADSACRQSTSRLVLEMVADMRLEYFEALKDGRKVKARWIKALHYVAMARALTLDRLLAAGLSYVVGAFRTGKS